MSESPANSPACPICGAACAPLGTVDFNKSCEEARGQGLPPSGRLVSYIVCSGCGFVFAPQFASWTAADFAREIYNAGYLQVDPDSAELRPKVNAGTLKDTFGSRGRSIRHLDYGGGAGRLGELLRASGWRSISYDPFFDADKRLEDLGRFQLITCFEVFEHVADVNGLMRRLLSLLTADGLILASTLLSDGQLNPGEGLLWWYAAPRNGHISLFSSRSLGLLAQRHGLTVASFSPDVHLLWHGEFPRWASHLLKSG